MSSTITYQRAAAGTYAASGRCRTNRRPRIHTHSEYTLGIVVRGRQIIHVRNRQYEATAGTAYWIAPGEPHRGFATGPGDWAYFSLYVPADLMPDFVGTSLNRGEAPATGVYRDEKLSEGLLILAHRCGGDPAEPQWSNRLMDAVARMANLMPVGEQWQQPSPEPDKIRQVKSMIRARLEEPLAVKWLARKVGWSPAYLIRAFKKHVGMSPYAWLIAERLNRAVAELKGGTSPVEAALLAGFYDQSHMNRHFTHAFQTTPARFQRELQAG